MKHIPGARTRQDIKAAVIPPGKSWVQSSIRGSVALMLFLAGYHHLAQIFAVLALMILIGSVEARIAIALSGGIGRLGRAKIGLKAKKKSAFDDADDQL